MCQSHEYSHLSYTPHQCFPPSAIFHGTFQVHSYTSRSRVVPFTRSPSSETPNNTRKKKIAARDPGARGASFSVLLTPRISRGSFFFSRVSFTSLSTEYSSSIHKWIRSHSLSFFLSSFCFRTSKIRSSLQMLG